MQSSKVRALLWVLASSGPIFAQAPSYDPDWYSAGQPYLKIKVAEDGIHRVDAAEIAAAGVELASLNPASLRLLTNGSEVPIWYEGGESQAGAEDYFLFVGERNTAKDELWVYNYDERLRSSSNRSLYTDTTTYFLTWGGPPGMRYRRVANDAVSGPLIERVRSERFLETDAIYFFGAPESSGNPLYTAGEGWYWTILSHGDPVIRATFTVGLTDFTQVDGDTVRVEVRLQGGTRVTHLGFVDLQFVDPNTNELTETALDSVSWPNYGSALLSAKLAQWQVPSPSLRVSVGSDNRAGASPNTVYIDYLAFSYNRTLNAESGPFQFASATSGAATFRLAGSPQTDVIVLKPQTAERYDVEGGGTFGDMTETGLDYWLSTPEGLRRPVVLMDRPSDLANPTIDADYVIISAPDLISSARDLAEYRQSFEGGQYRTMVVNIQDVYDQFDYGRATPNAIRRFINHMQSWQDLPKFVTIWGDALYPDARRPKFGWEVPSFGNASSDGWFAMQTGGDLSDYFESVPIGRITIRANESGSAFVDKLRAYESRPPSDWQKRAIMMSGGNTISEQTSLRSHTRRWGATIVDEPFGGDVKYFHKTSSAALDPTFLDSVDAAITRGSGWLAFFGHSAADTWEIVTEPPPQFGNSQTLPIVVSLGCFTGAFARGDGSAFDQPPFAELLVTESLNGAIAHYGGSTSSSISAAAQIADPFYNLVFNGGMRTLGEAVVESKKIFLGPSTAASRIETALQYNLIGDPATRMALPEKPNFHIEARSVRVTPDGPVAGIDSTLNVTVSVENWGLIPDDSLTVNLRRISPGGGTSTFEQRIPPFPLLYDVSFGMPVGEADAGENRFIVEVDANGEHAETSEDDNSTEISQPVFASGVVHLYPSDLGLLTSRSPALLYGKASAGESQLTVLAELDTTHSFDSGALISETLEARALSSWTPPSPLIDGATYHWRLAVESDEQPEWRTRSFTVREDLPSDGWLQKGSLFRQSDHSPFLTFRDGAWHLGDFNVDIRIRSTQFRGSASNTIIVGGFEHETLAIGFAVVIVSVDGLFKASDRFIPYPNSRNIDPDVERRRLRDFLETAQENEFVFVNSRFFLVPAGVFEMPDETAAIFRELGSTEIDSVDLQDLWNFGIRIGDDAPLVDEWQDRDPELGPHILWSDLSIPARFPSGGSQSPPIGPAIRWHEARITGAVGNDRSSIETFVLGIQGDTLGSTKIDPPAGAATIDLGFSGLNIDARVHPFIRLAVTLTDSTRLDTPQLVDWYVGYDPVSEMVVDAPLFETVIDTVSEGDPLDVSVNVINGGPSAIDSAFVGYTITDRDNRSSLAAIDTLIDLAAGALIVSSATLETIGKVGNNRVTVVARQSRGPEPAAFNNTAIGSFRVRGDDTPPAFLLTVDGASFPNDPRVINTTDDPTLPFFSSRPTFQISVTDDNEFLALSDTSVINLTLDNVRIAYTRQDVEFVPGTGSDNEARLIFTPDFTGEDTTHTLKVWAQDASGNSEPTKEEPYTLSFRVQTAAEVENLYPYPNPMHNFTTFMFRLRGADASLVDDLRIRVYTISGRPVREFDLLDNPGLLEDGGLRIGWNRVVWDGRDEDGDLLATGVYLYKVFFRSEGRDVSVNNDSGIEKIAIIR